jgi:hypothetical protein
MVDLIATVRFAFTISSLEDSAAALRRLQEAALTAGFEMRDGSISPAPHDTPAATGPEPVTAGAQAGRYHWTGHVPLPPKGKR